MQSGAGKTFAIPLQRADGSLGYFEATVSLIHDLQGELRGYRGIVRDVSDQIAYQQQLLEMAYRDPLTGLGNRKAFDEQLGQALLRAGSGGSELALLYLDLDRFKEVNDRFGHDIGDALLRTVAERVRSTLRQPDKAYRLGGDEFAVLLEDSQENNPQRLAERLLAALVQPIALNGERIDFVTPSIGIALYRGMPAMPKDWSVPPTAPCTRPSASATTIACTRRQPEMRGQTGSVAGFRQSAKVSSPHPIGEPFPMPALERPAIPRRRPEADHASRPAPVRADPLTLNLLVFALLIGFAMQQFSHWVDLLMPSLPDWLSFLQYIVWPLFVLLVLVIVFFTFTMVANIISAPFNGFLSEKVEVVVRGRDDFPPFSWAELLAMIPRTMGREIRKLAYFLPRALVLLVLSFVPGVNLIATPLWILFGIWMMAVQYIDYPADNHKLGWNEMLARLRSKRWACMGFGGVTYLALLIPLVNLVMMPAAVAGATLFWVREEGEKALVK